MATFKHRFVVRRKVGAEGWYIIDLKTNLEVATMRTRTEARKEAQRLQAEYLQGQTELATWASV